MQIQVDYNEFRNWPQDVPVIVLEDNEIVWCNHADTYTEEEGESEGMGLKFQPRQIEVCVKCDAWRLLDGEWVKD